jgi:S1-C subfamily serine protease
MRVAALEHLTGPSRGEITWLGEPMLDISLDGNGRVAVGPSPPDGVAENAVARLRRTGAGHVIEPLGGNPIWVNRRSVDASVVLNDHDMIEFCERGPISRYFLYVDGQRIRQTVADIFVDAGGYLRASRKPLARRLSVAVGQVLRRLGRETTVLFRAGVVLALIAMAAIVYQQSRINTLLRIQIEGGEARMDDISRILARTRDEAVTPGDLQALRHELATRVTTTAERLSEIERLSETSVRVIEQSAASVAFLQGSYGFREPGTGRMLRYLVDEAGEPLVLPNGLAPLTLEGDGPVAERQFTGTGFVLKDSGLMVTNRHVGEPWEHDSAFGLFEREGVEPVMIRFIAYLPGVRTGAEIEVVRKSEAADIALIGFKVPPDRSIGLPLSSEPPKPGDKVILLGYPTGLKSMIVQAGEAFVRQLQELNDTDFWSIARRLSDAGRIFPLASQGIVGRTSEETIVYDAATTSGGSGGPVLDAGGAVIAVNMAVLPEYSGSNFGIPVARLRELLTQATQ